MRGNITPIAAPIGINGTSAAVWTQQLVIIFIESFIFGHLINCCVFEESDIAYICETLEGALKVGISVTSGTFGFLWIPRRT